ncbi:MAG TPA: hypothetical protein VJR23_03725 [Candidatus Acidoferrales bacterium]|nr:hypothetical protein [Candidatus Acidoferrales bacterium]
MKKIALLSLLFASAVFAQSQSTSQTLPTPEQCTANLHAWYPNRQTDAKELHADELETRVAQMAACSGMASGALAEYKTLVDDAAEYERLVDTYEHSYAQRLFHFIQRHGELAEFAKEDAAGKR